MGEEHEEHKSGTIWRNRI